MWWVLGGEKGKSSHPRSPTLPRSLPSPHVQPHPLTATCSTCYTTACGNQAKAARAVLVPSHSYSAQTCTRTEKSSFRLTTARDTIAAAGRADLRGQPKQAAITVAAAFAVPVALSSAPAPWPSLSSPHLEQLTLALAAGALLSARAKPCDAALTAWRVRETTGARRERDISSERC